MNFIQILYKIYGKNVKIKRIRYESNLEPIRYSLNSVIQSFEPTNQFVLRLSQR